MSNINTNFENNDFDNFLNIDNDYTPVAASPATHIPSLAHQSSAASSSTLASSQPAFSGPTHQYDNHRQQTGLPVGGLASTFAVNQANGLHYRPGNMGFVMPTETLNIPLSNLEELDFGSSQFYDTNDMDFDTESPSDLNSMFYAGGSTQIKSESSQSTPIQRIYPGMHSQQAAQAKAAQAQRQQEMLRQQQQKQIPGQLPLPTQAPKSAKDPHVEESISRLLNRMRQSSTASSLDESTPAPGGMSSIPRLRKDEEDMDEDERLLASEEGKKLSSKERRQLRNKVSARAFRSRRKEYIGQLEGEVAAKVQEANDLRVQNRQLMEENTRLTDLTRMLLSSQAFSGFLQELSNSGMTLPSSAIAPSTQQPQQRKDVSIHEAVRQLQNQNQQQVGMTLIPETQIDTSDFSGSWAAPLPSNDFHVFSVTEMPEPPALDMSVLSEKNKISSSTSSTAKKNGPQLPSWPSWVENLQHTTSQTDAETEAEDGDTTDLYATPTISPRPFSSQATPANEVVSTTQSTQNLEVDSKSSLAAKLEKLCSELEDSCERLGLFLP